MKKKIRNDRGFTLVEIMAVVVIIGLLVGTVAVVILPKILRSEQTVARMEIETYEAAVKEFRMVCKVYPDRLEELTQKQETPNGEIVGPWVDKINLDPWGNAYYYDKNNGDDFEIKSFGSDGRPDGEGENKDISNRDD